MEVTRAGGDNESGRRPGGMLWGQVPETAGQALRTKSALGVGIWESWWEALNWDGDRLGIVQGCSPGTPPLSVVGKG